MIPLGSPTAFFNGTLELGGNTTATFNNMYIPNLAFIDGYDGEPAGIYKTRNL